jgi:hypothetical protein
MLQVIQDQLVIQTISISKVVVRGSSGGENLWSEKVRNKFK